jgi:beta-N-acetylhexosaminidase
VIVVRVIIAMRCGHIRTCLVLFICFFAGKSYASAVETYVASMSAEQLAGQMMIIGLDGDTLFAGSAGRLSVITPGGIIIQGQNISTIPRLKKLTQQLQEYSVKKSLPLFIAIDQEGGAVARLNSGITVFPGNMASGSADDENAVYASSLITGYELRSIGINMNLLPCLDLFDNPANPVINIRSYGNNINTVSAFGAASIQGLQSNGNCLSVAKHFPGHGRTAMDSHSVLPKVSITEKELYERDMKPFAAAFNAHTAAVMTAHVEYTPYGNIPATVSPLVMQSIRKTFGFKGLIITDDLKMKAITNSMSVSDAAVRAIDAGADIVLLSSTDSDLEKVHAKITDYIKTKKMNIERVRESVVRIITAKKAFNIVSVEDNKISRNNFKPVIDEDIYKKRDLINKSLSEKALYYYESKTGKGMIPALNKSLIICNNDSMAAMMKNSGLLVKNEKDAIRYIQSNNSGVTIVYYAADEMNKSMLSFLKRGINAGKIKLFLILLKNPFPVIGQFEKSACPSFLCTFSPTEQSMEAAVRVLKGNYTPLKKVPSFMKGMLAGSAE